MRKLSKKISMLMVLAMLVSLFSGIVSASAASAWSFYNKTADDAIRAYSKETYKMVPDQFADFDLCKDDEVIDTDVYRAVYSSSDEDVVWVNAKNGKLRAQKDAEIGATAEITAHITNKVTGVEADRSFTIEIVEAEAEVEEAEYLIDVNFGDEPFLVGDEYELKATVTDLDEKAVEAKVVFAVDGKAIEGKYVPAAEGDVVIVATVTIGEEEFEAEYACTVVNANIFEVKQISAKSFTMTFPEIKDLSKVTKDDIYVGSAATVDGTLYKEYVGSVKAEKNVLTVNLYNEMAKDAYITVKYANETAGFKVSKGDVDQVVVVDGPVMIGEARKLNIKLLSNGIEVTNDALLSNVTVEIVSGGENANVVNGNQIIFWEAGKTAVVKATYHTYDFATNGDGTERAFVSAPATITSRATAVSLGNITEWTLTNQANWWDIKWNGKNFIALDDSNYRVVGKLVETTTTTYDNPVTKRTDELGARLAYESSNTAVLYVDSTGKLYPITQGTADIIVKDTLNNNAIVGVYTVTVKANKQLVAITATLASKNLISENESVVIAVSGKDQYGEDYNIEHTKAGAVSFTNVADNSVALDFGYQWWGGRYELKNADDLDTKEGKTYTVEVKVGDKKAYVSFTVKSADADTTRYTYGFDADSHTFSTNVTDQTENYSKPVKIATYDKNGLLAEATGSVKIQGILPNANQTDLSEEKDAAKAAVTGGAYYVVVDKPYYVGNIGEIVTLKDGVINFNYLLAKDDVLEKAAAGSYTLKLYKANVIEGDKIGFTLIDTLPITVKDDQTQYVASVKATKADVDFALISNAVSGKSVDSVITGILDTCYDLKLGNDTYKFAGLDYVAGSLNLVAVDPNLSIKEVKVMQLIKVKKGADGTAGKQYKVQMTISLYNQSITLK